MTSGFHDRIWHGAAWYPELWPDQVAEDLRLMREAGVDLARVGEFAWAFLEPSEGRFALGWLKRVLDRAHGAGVSIVLCTPTPTPPRWLTLKYPEVLRVDADGRPFTHGARQHVSHVSRRYRAFSRRITEKLARAFGRHPALAAWQTDNEFLCHVGGDYGPEAEKAWHAWLRAKYGSVAELNRRWKTGIWSETYPSFDSIPVPAKPTWIHHVSLASDWIRFTSDTVVAFQKEQVDIIRKHSKAPISHNQILPDQVLSDDLFADLDFAATDFYAAHGDTWHLFRTLDILRGAKMRADGRTIPYVVLETSPSQNGHTQAGHAIHPPGFLPAEAMLFLGHGGNGFCYWLWRQQASGVETCHGAVLSAWGTRSAGWEDVKKVSALIKKAGPILRMPPARAEVAIHDSKEARVHLQVEKLWKEYDRFRTPLACHRALRELGIWRDVRFEDADISGYKAVLSPFMPILTSALVRRMERFVRDGGLWIVGPMSGCRTEDGTVPTDAGLGALDRIAGVRTLWTAGLDTKGDFRGRRLPLAGYCAALEPADKGCRVLGRYGRGVGQGLAWAVERRIGRGKVVLLAAHPKDDYAKVIDAVLRPLALRRLQATWGTEILPREDGRKRAWLIANWDGKGGSVTLPAAGTDLLTGKRLKAGRLKVLPFGTAAVLR